MYKASSRNKSKPAGLEYGLFIFLIAAFSIAMLTPLGASITDLYEVVTTMVNEVSAS